MAAGVSMEEEQIDVFRHMLNENVGLTEADMTEKVSIDMQLPLGYVSETLVEELELLEPFGKGNTKPVFVEKEIELLKGEILGKNQNVMKMQVRDLYGTTMEAMYFGDVELFLTHLKEKYGAESVECMLRGFQTGMKQAFTYYPTINEYMGRKTLQIVIQNYQ